MARSDAESHVLEQVDERLLVASLVAFIRVPSVTGTEANSDPLHAPAKMLDNARLDVDTWKFDTVALQADDPFPGEENGRSVGYGLVGMTGPGYPAPVLQGHVDVGPTGDLQQWHDGDPGIRGDARTSVGHPFGDRRRGRWTRRFRHGAARPQPRFLATALPCPISIGRIRAGDWDSSVPALLVAEGRLGVILDEEPAAAQAAFEHAIAGACAADPLLRDHPATVTWPGGQFASGRIADNHAVIDEISDVMASLLSIAIRVGQLPFLLATLPTSRPIRILSVQSEFDLTMRRGRDSSSCVRRPEPGLMSGGSTR